MKQTHRLNPNCSYSNENSVTSLDFSLSGLDVGSINTIKIKTKYKNEESAESIIQIQTSNLIFIT